jgi:hypothetical protein
VIGGNILPKKVKVLNLMSIKFHIVLRFTGAGIIGENQILHVLRGSFSKKR